jgi:hypothetical protein
VSTQAAQVSVCTATPLPPTLGALSSAHAPEKSPAPPHDRGASQRPGSPSMDSRTVSGAASGAGAATHRAKSIARYHPSSCVARERCISVLLRRHSSTMYTAYVVSVSTPISVKIPPSTAVR